MDREYSGKTVFISGAASGIALLAGQNYVRAGANVVLADVNEAGLAAACESLAEFGGQVAAVRCDVTDYASVVQAKDEALRRFGAIDILLCCAGGAETRIRGYGTPFWETPIEVYDFGIDLNLKGAFYCIHAIMPVMVKQKSGVIITMGSVAGLEPAYNEMGYSASKAGIIGGLTPSVASVGAEHGIRCCSVSPGPVLTRKSMNAMSTKLRRAADPQEIVDLILYLTGKKASFITGQNFVIDGGRLLMSDKTPNQNYPLRDE